MQRLVSIDHQEQSTNAPPPIWWVGGWGPRCLASKRERGPVRVPSSLTEEEP